MEISNPDIAKVELSPVHVLVEMFQCSLYDK
jgi:hypothetical protein